MIHQLKIQKKFFKEILSGNKTFEVRKKDRDFHVNDYLALNELEDPDKLDSNSYPETGRSILVLVDYILDDPEYCKEGYLIMGFRPCKIINLPKGSEPVPCNRNLYTF